MIPREYKYAKIDRNIATSVDGITHAYSIETDENGEPVAEEIEPQYIHTEYILDLMDKHSENFKAIQRLKCWVHFLLGCIIVMGFYIAKL